MSDFEVLAAFGAALIALLVLLLLTRRPKGRPALQPQTKGRGKSAGQRRKILVDGSNVMHWGGDPSALVVARVVLDLETKGLVPYVCFDANAGYKLAGRYMKARDLVPLIGLPAHRILVVDKGVVADEVLLQEAEERDLQVVTNDRFRDWTDQHPWVKDHKRFRRGTWKEGSVVWQSGRQR